MVGYKGPGPDFQNPYRNIETHDGDPMKGGPAPPRPPMANDRQVEGFHYKEHSGVECPYCRNYLEHWDLAWGGKWDFFQYCITKYLLRWRHKNGLNDLRKAAHYLEKYLEVLEKEQATPGDPTGS